MRRQRILTIAAFQLLAVLRPSVKRWARPLARAGAWELDPVAYSTRVISGRIRKGRWRYKRHKLLINLFLKAIFKE